jgi:Fanconi anemia group J protein
MDSFASELGVPFEIQMEARHVVDMDKQVSYYFVQVWAAAVSTGPDNISLNASYKNADGYAFQVLCCARDLASAHLSSIIMYLHR